MIDVEPLIRAELQRRAPVPDQRLANWNDVLQRAGEPARRRRRAATVILAVAVLAALAVGPLGSAVTHVVGGFSNWLRGTPGTPAPQAVQRDFDAANQRSGAPFPGSPRLRKLLQTTLDGRRFFLYGFETRQVVCLRVAVRALEGAGPQAACVSRADLRRSGDLVLPMKANLSVGHIGKLPRTVNDPPTVPRYLLTFGIVADEVDRIGVRIDGGTTPATLRNGAFLHVFRPGHRGVWARAVYAYAPGHRRDVVPLSVQVSGQPLLRTGLQPRGPAAVERTVTGGTIGWFIRREKRGLSAAEAHVSLANCCRGYARVIEPDRSDFLRILVSDHSTIHMPFQLPAPRPGEHRICFGVVTRGTVSTNCTTVERLFRERPLSLSWGFSGGGQQIWLVEGLASDDVARIAVFTATGEHWNAPLRDNATVFRIQRAKFPARIVGYDRAGRVIAVQKIPGG